MSLPALYQLAAEFHALELALAEIEDDPQALADTLEGCRAPLEQKVVNVVKYTRNLETLAEQIKAAEKQMADRRKGLENKAARIREHVKGCMEYAQVLEVSCPFFKVAIRRNPPSVIIENADALPLDYVVLPPIPPPAPDKAKIARDLKAGLDVPGASLDSSKTRLDIR